MSIEFLSDLENKIDSLIATLQQVREENVRLAQSLEQTNGRLSTMELENQELKNELESIKVDSQGRQDKLNAAAERIQGLLTKLESVQ